MKHEPVRDKEREPWWRAKIKLLGITLTWGVAITLWVFVAMKLWFPWDYSGTTPID